ncbi:MAG: hypothetical protein LBM92_03725, partial [Opitutaceae bacterium]|nr:hypothetical protein [Opitutaceae bacterium]
MKSATRPHAATILRPLLRGLQLLALGILPVAASAATYTVTDGGDDQASGTTQLRPILAGTAQPGDEIRFAGTGTDA